MPLARTYDAASGQVIVTIKDAYLDRLSRWSDIQEYMPFLYEQARSRPGCRVLELGARRGNSTVAFLAGVHESGGRLWSCDIADVRKIPGSPAGWQASLPYSLMIGDDMDPRVLEKMPAQVDVLFIDTSHTYEHTLAECRAYVPRVAPGGVALFHDTRAFGDWSEPGDTVPPVARALEDYCAEAALRWEDLPGVYGLGVIRVG